MCNIPTHSNDCLCVVGISQESITGGRMMLRIIIGLFFMILLGIIAWLIHPIVFFLWIGIPSVGVIYNWKQL